MKDLTVMLEDRPGELAKLGRATGAAGINIEGMGGDAREGSVLHLLVEDTRAARDALSGADVEVLDERDALVVEIENRPGTIGEVAGKLAEAGVNVDFVYVTFDGCRVVIGVGDLQEAQAALQ